MARRWRQTGKFDPSEDASSANPVVILSSSDDEAANEDLSLAVIEKAKRKCLEASNEPSDVSCEEIKMNNEEIEKNGGGEKSKKKIRPKKKKKKTKESAENETPISLHVPEEGPNGTVTEPIPIEENEAPDNIILRRLLRGARYFDPQENHVVQACYKCGEEGHMAVNCKGESREKPCFICGLFGHNGKKCTQGCHICKKKGHLSKTCPEKNKRISHDSKVCLKCGEFGHEMFSCVNEYPPEDMQEIECYVCKTKGHLCCADVADSYPKEVSCYNCAQSGHTGAGCAKPKGDIGSLLATTMCFRCGEEGHFARGCPKAYKSHRSKGDFSTPRWKPSKEHREKLGFRSAPNNHHANRGSKRKGDKREESNSTPKSRNKRGWIVDDPGDFPTSSSPNKKYKSHTKGHTEKSHRRSGLSSRGDYSSTARGEGSGGGQSFGRYKRFGSPSSRQRWGGEYSDSKYSNSHQRFGDWD